MGSWRGHCDCRWIGPERKTRKTAKLDYERHATAEHGGVDAWGNWVNQALRNSKSNGSEATS